MQYNEQINNRLGSRAKRETSMVANKKQYIHENNDPIKLKIEKKKQKKTNEPVQIDPFNHRDPQQPKFLNMYFMYCVLRTQVILCIFGPRLCLSKDKSMSTLLITQVMNIIIHDVN